MLVGNSVIPVPTTTEFRYDLANQLVHMVDPSGIATDSTFDQLGNTDRVTVSKPGSTSLVTDYDFDSFSQQVRMIVNPDAYVVPAGDPNQAVDFILQVGYFDRLGRRTGSQAGFSSLTTYDYDRASRMTGLTDPSDSTTTWAYNAMDWPESETITIGDVGQVGEESSRNFYYDLVGNRRYSVDRNGRATRYSYDGLHQLQTESWLTSVEIQPDSRIQLGSSVGGLNYDYDVIGQLKSVDDRFSTGKSSHSYEYNHDLGGRTTDELQTFYALGSSSSAPTTVGWQRAYDEASNMTTVAAYTGASLSLGSVTGTLDHIDTRTFDAQNRTEAIHRSLSGNPAAVSGDQFVDFNRNAAGRVTRTQRIDDAASLIKSGLTTTTQYDLGRIAAIEHDYLFNRRSRYEVDWTASGDISRTDTYLNPGQVSTSAALYSHDARGQLLLESTFQASGPVDNAYPTDASGNRTSDTVIARDNRLSSDADWNYAYDQEGNLTRKTSKTDTTTWYYTWDHRNRLLTAEEFGDSNPGSSNFRQGVRYAYDGFDQLIARYEILSHTAGSIGGLKALNHETYAHEGGQIGLHLVNDTPAVRYLWSDGVDQLLAEQTVANDAIDWTLTDHLGSVRGRVSSATGALAQHVNFDAFGNPLETQGTAPTAASVDLIFGYTGRPLDSATGQQNNHHRWYDRETGRWLSKDPIGSAAGDANLYRYVGNQPTTLTDPSGLVEEVPGASTSIPTIDPIATIDLAIELTETANLREFYVQSAAKIGECDLPDAEKRVLRDALKDQVRLRQGKLAKAITDALLRERDRTAFSSARNNAGKTNAAVNAQARVFRVAGRLLIVVSIGHEVYNIATADDPLAEVPRSGGRLAGGFLGGSAGAGIGLRFGPAGVVICSVGGGIAGSIVGEKAIITYQHEIRAEVIRVEWRNQQQFLYGHTGGARP